MREYAHLAIRMVLRRAIQEVGEACDNVRRATDHAQQETQLRNRHTWYDEQAGAFV